MLTSPLLIDRVNNIFIDKDERDKNKPSDHVPIVMEVDL